MADTHSPDNSIKPVEIPKDIAGILPACVRRANSIQITDAESYEEAGYAMKFIVKGMRNFEDWYNVTVVNPAHQLHKSYCAARDEKLKEGETARAIVSRKMKEWDEKKERERQQLEASLRAKALEDAKARAAAEAAELKAKGDTELAKMVAETPIAAPVVFVESDVPKVAGISKPKMNAKWRTVDKSKMKLKYLKEDREEIWKTVRACGADAAEIVGGIEVTFEQGDYGVRS